MRINEEVRKLLITLIIGSAGGYLFSLAHLPLAWMLGAMSFCAVAAMMRVPIGVSSAIRPFTAILLGTMLGASFSPSMFAHISNWLAPAIGLLFFLVVSSVLSFVYFTRVVGLEPVTAFFAGMPGGIVEMVMLGEENGADAKAIALVHAARIFLVVLTLPFILRLVNGVDASSASPIASNALSLFDLGWLVAAAAIGAALGWVLKLPIQFLLGPMLVSATFHLLGWTSFSVPVEVISGAQLILGATIGCRFVGATASQILRVVIQSLGAAAILLTTTFVFAYGVDSLTHSNWSALVLAYSPGGLAEMSMVALSLNMEVAFVVAHHIARVVFITVGASFAFSLWSRLKLRVDET